MDPQGRPVKTRKLLQFCLEIHTQAPAWPDKQRKQATVTTMFIPPERRYYSLSTHHTQKPYWNVYHRVGERVTAYPNSEWDRVSALNGAPNPRDLMGNHALGTSDEVMTVATPTKVLSQASC